MDQEVKVIGNRKVTETKQGSLKTRVGQGEVKVAVLVQGCTECNTIDPSNNQVHPIASHLQTFMSPELNYEVHNKELLAIFEAFKSWHHYLEGTPTPINVITDYKNLKYFSTTKILT